MQIAHHRLGALVEHMGIDLRRRDVGVAEQILNDAQVRAVLQQMTGEGVAKDVRAHPRRRDSRRRGDALEIARESLARQVAARTRRGKEPGASRRAGRGLIEQSAKHADRGARRSGQRREPLLVALAAHGDERGLGGRDRIS